MDFFQHKNTTPPFQIADEAEACAAVFTACLRANEIDGEVSQYMFRVSIETRNIFKGKSVDALVEAADRYYQQAGNPALLIDAAVGAIRPQTRVPLFFHCLDMMMSDGVVTPREHRAFLYLRKKLQVPDSIAEKALEVLLLKNQL